MAGRAAATRRVGRASAVTAKGQTTIPVEYRRSLDLHPGDRVIFRLEGDHLVLSKAQALDTAWNEAQSRLMSEWASAEDAVFDA